MSHPIDSLQHALGDHPAVGYVVSLASIVIGAVPQWVPDMQSWLGLASIFVGLAVGVTTLLIQVKKLREKPPERSRIIRTDGGE